LGYKEQQHGLAEMAQDAHNSESHSREVAEGITNKNT